MLQQTISDAGNISNNPIQRIDPIAQQVNQRYINNLQEIVMAGKAKNIPVFIILIPANLHHPPELSFHNPKLSMEKKNAWEKLSQQALQTECKKAIELWDKAISIDPWPAKSWYHRGICKLERNIDAHTDLLTALNLDMNPSRPPQSLQQQILTLQTPIISVAEHFSKTENYGTELFHDKCHLNPSGYNKVAQSIVNTLISELGWGL